MPGFLFLVHKEPKITEEKHQSTEVVAQRASQPCHEERQGATIALHDFDSQQTHANCSVSPAPEIAEVQEFYHQKAENQDDKTSNDADRKESIDYAAITDPASLSNDASRHSDRERNQRCQRRNYGDDSLIN